MAMVAAAHAELCRLRRDIARIEGRLPESDRLTIVGSAAEGAAGAASAETVLRPRERRGRLSLGIPSFDRLIGGGLPLAALHEVRAGESRDGGVASGFVLALVARLASAGRVSSIVWIGEADIRREAGKLYAPGLVALGLDPTRVVEVAVRTETEALWAFEAALSCRGLDVAVCELRKASLDLSATRRCALRARETGVTGFLLRVGDARAEPSAAELRFGVSPAPAGEIGRFAQGVGRMAWRLTLEKNRLGPTGAFTMEWNAHERSFVERRNRRADPQPLSAAPLHRPPHPAPAERGDVSEAILRRAS
jgi:protein ImuA